MKVDRHSLLFFDASCLIAAAGSPSGGSSFLLSLCAQQVLRAAVSQAVLLEAERNILAKLGGSALSAYRNLVVTTPMLLVPLPAPSELRLYRETVLGYDQIVGDKDEHVVAACLASNAQFLLTLDKRLMAKVVSARLPVPTLSPGDFIKTVLILHDGFPHTRG